MAHPTMMWVWDERHETCGEGETMGTVAGWVAMAEMLKGAGDWQAAHDAYACARNVALCLGDMVRADELAGDMVECRLEGRARGLVIG